MGIWYDKILILKNKTAFKNQTVSKVTSNGERVISQFRVSLCKTDSQTEKLGDPTSYGTCNLNLTHAGSLDV